MRERRLTSRPVYSGRVVSLRVDGVELPDGVKTTREVIDHAPAVVVVAEDEAGEILLVRQYRYAAGEELLELPAGGLEPGEEPLAGAQRELAEETGLRAEVWEPLGAAFSAPGFCNELLHFFRARGLRPGPAQPDEDERLVVERRTRAEVKDLLRRGELQDCKTIAGLALAGHWPGDDRRAPGQ